MSQERHGTAPLDEVHPAGRYDVVIVGFGPTGVTAANLLGQAGLSVLVLERDSSLYSRARAISTDDEVLRIWQRIGLADELAADMLTGRPIEFVDQAGRPFIRAELPARGHGYPAQAFLYQPALERRLRAGVERFGTVKVLLGHECLRVGQDDTGVDVLISGPDGHRLRARATYLIAADGGSSPIRTRLGIGFEGRTYTDRWVVIDTKVLADWPGGERMRFHCDPARPAVDCPTPLGHHRWEFPVLPGEDPDALVTEAAVRRLLRRYGITDRTVRILRAVVYHHHVRFAARWRVDRVFLAGDAAHVMPPWVGQGMAAGVRDAVNLSWKLAAVLCGSAPPRLLDSYETERQPHVRAITRRAVMAGRIITERRRGITGPRNMLFRAVEHIGPLRRRLQQALWIPHAHYRRGFLHGSGHRAVGHLPPQPSVLDGQGRRRRLDDVLGSGWAVVHTSSAPAAACSWTDQGHPVLRLLPAGSDPAPGAVVDTDGVLTSWLARRDAEAIALRPDGFVYAAADAARPLPPPPVARRATAQPPSTVTEALS